MVTLLATLVVAYAQTITFPNGAAAYTRPAADSAGILRHVRSAQSSFESFRRTRLPRGDQSSGPCDVRIGRYCYWRGDEDGEEDKDPPAEAPAVRERRASLITSLDSAARVIPGDPWVAGQLVRYLVEANRFDDALAFTRRGCLAGSAWCAALAGFAAHQAGRFPLADSLFTTSLSAMDSAQRCKWVDISDLLDDELQDRFKPLDCAARAQLARRVLILGAPLYSVATTDLWTEHLARVTRARIAEKAASPDGEYWANDERELVIRYGWPRWYSQAETSPMLTMEFRPSITGHDSGMPYYFLPTTRVLDHVAETTPDDWHLDDRTAPAGYAPSFARSVHELPAQIAVFRRGDSALVVAAWDARKDTTMLGRSLQSALVLAHDDSIDGITVDSAAHTVGRATVIGRIDSGLVSLELRAPADKRAARLRVGVATHDSLPFALSDLLLYSAPGAPTALADVRDSALTSTVVPGSRTVGVYWEAYGLDAPIAQVRYTLSVQQVGVGWMHRAAERLHLTDPTTGLRVQWEEVPQRTNGIAGRAVRLDLSRLRSGTYHMELAAHMDGRAAAVASREIIVR